MKIATFKAIIRDDSEMVAGIAAIEGGSARFFVRQDSESADQFVGRISTWVKAQGGERLQMQPPDLLPTGIDVGTVIAELRKKIAGGEDAPEAEFDVPNADLVANVQGYGGTRGDRQDN